MTEKESHSSARWDQLKKHLRVNRALLPLKAVMFLFYGALTAVLLPYITLHMLQIGITVEEVGIIYAVLPFASCLGPPAAGMIADKIGNYKAVLMGSILATGGFHTLLLSIDAHSVLPERMSSSYSNNSSENMWVYLACQQSRKTFIEYPERCTQSVNSSDDLPPTELPSSLHLLSTTCLESCNDNQTGGIEICIENDGDATECYPLDKGLPLQVMFEKMNSFNNASNCLFPVNQLVLSNTSERAVLNCDCPIKCPALIVQNNSLFASQESLQLTENFDNYNHNRGFWLYLIIRILATASLGTSFTMLDATTICLIKKHKGQLGRQRLFGVLGSAAFALTTGILLDWTTSLNNGVRDYATVFYFADALLLPVLLCLIMVEVSTEKSEGKFFKNVLQVMRLIHIDIFMVMMLLLGVFWGFLEAFLFIFLIELNASSYLLGFTVTLGALVGIPFLYVSDIIVKKIGKLVILVSAFFIYSVRFTGYSFITDPWMSLPFEALEAVTIHLMGVSCSMYCAACAPAGLLATLQGMAGSFHYSVGRGTGSFIGGILIALYGTRVTFRIFGIAAGICGILYIIIYCSYLRKIENAVEQRKSVIDKEDKNAGIVFHLVKQLEAQDEEDNMTGRMF